MFTNTSDVRKHVLVKYSKATLVINKYFKRFENI